MWTVIYMAKNREIAEKLREALENAGLLVKLIPIAKESEECSYDVLVPDAEVEQAHNIIIDFGF